MMYCGYQILEEGDHVKVIAPNGTEWTEDTAEDARQEIREEWQLR